MITICISQLSPLENYRTYKIKSLVKVIVGTVGQNQGPNAEMFEKKTGIWTKM